MTNSFFNSIEIVKELIRWRKHLIIVGLIALVASAILSSPFFIKPKYKSYALVYPSNLMAYSDESATEQMLQLAQSSDIRNWIIDAFDLYNHYEIDTVNNPHFRSKAIKMYEENVNIRKTEFESMEITVLDTDPLIASRMVDSLIRYFDIKTRKMQAEKSHEVMVIAQNQLMNKKREMDSMETILKDYRLRYGILEYKSQSKEATRGYLRALSSGNGRAISESQSLMNSLKEKGGEFNSLSEHLWRIRGDYNDLKMIYENAERDVYKNLTYANVVTRPQPADKKSYPVRWLIVVISVGSALFVSFLTILIFKSKNQFA
ncbi:MAG: hypothetical protein DWQ44_09425 [Bacteroidetes bacterium]|nr:MAG: hypothetical protein DWQ33_02355 [Bacteroidota bacterium]REK06504.1 MAG: hypothetical protein DWQ39_03215 [Bacteroidota bacterium]REK33270.1 MAG: hypothetical protein DWQ44_09425 [Bacteroidota bacterium]REK47107.1 MAG: hypothetical protein DWQ48_13760 [Bacteroidota bacterium]